MARIREAEGDLDGALDLLDEAERLYVGDFFPDVRPVAALKARVWVAQGRLDEALGWARERGLSADGRPQLPARVRAHHAGQGAPGPARSRGADGSIGEATGSWSGSWRGGSGRQDRERHRDPGAAGARPPGARRSPAAALVPLERALALAEPEGYVRIFVDEGAAMAALLQAAAKRGIAPTTSADSWPPSTRPTTARPANQDLVEPLSERELDVLRLLGTELAGPEIARELMVSLNTMRTHTKSIYTKLGVNNRRAAVRRADELDLLPRARNR